MPPARSVQCTTSPERRLFSFSLPCAPRWTQRLWAEVEQQVGTTRAGLRGWAGAVVPVEWRSGDPTDVCGDLQDTSLPIWFKTLATAFPPKFVSAQVSLYLAKLLHSASCTFFLAPLIASYPQALPTCPRSMSYKARYDTSAECKSFSN